VKFIGTEFWKWC